MGFNIELDLVLLLSNPTNQRSLKKGSKVDLG